MPTVMTLSFEASTSGCFLCTLDILFNLNSQCFSKILQVIFKETQLLIIVYVFSYVSCPRIVGIGNGYMCSQFMYLRSKYIDRCSADILISNYIDIR